MILLVDAFNLIYKFPELEEDMARGELEQAMRGLLARLAEFRKAYTAHKSRQLVVHVFFDGKRKRGDETRRLKQDGLDLYFSHDLSADHLIMEFIGRHATPGDLTIVSTDKKIREFARKHRCQRRTSEEFAEWLLETIQPAPEDDDDGSAKPESVSEDEIAYWQDMFRKQ